MSSIDRDQCHLLVSHHSHIEVMDILDGPNFMHSRLFLRPFGLWPFQDRNNKFVYRAVALLAIFTIFLPHIMKAYEFRSDFHLVVMCIPSLLYYIHYIIKFVYLATCEEKFRGVLENIRDDFEVFKGEHLDQLKIYSSEARRFNAFYTVYLCSTIVIYNCTAFIPRTLDFLVPLDNATRPQNPVRYIKYNVRPIDDNYYFGLAHGMMVDAVAIALFIGFDSLYINCAQHACALYKIVEVELVNFTKLHRGMERVLPQDFKVKLERSQENLYEKLMRTVMVHKHAIEFSALPMSRDIYILLGFDRFTNNLESAYALINFLMIGISVATMTLTEFETIAHVNDVDIMCRFAFYTGGELLTILCQNWPGQRIKDHSFQVHSSCYECEWYRKDISYKSKKLLLFMMLKSGKPSRLTAGKLFTLDLENYVTIFNASLSYFAFLSSFANISVR